MHYIRFINLKLSCLSFLSFLLSFFKHICSTHSSTEAQTYHSLHSKLPLETTSISINPSILTSIPQQHQHLVTQAPNTHISSPAPDNTRTSASAMAISKTRAAHLCTSITCHQAKTDNCRRSRTQARLSDPNYLRVPDSVWNHIHYHNQIDKDYMQAAKNTLTRALAADTTSSPMIGLIKV